MEKALHRGALEKIEMVLSKIIKRLKDVAHKMPRSIELNEKVMKEHAIQKKQQLRREFFEQWHTIEESLTGCLSKTGHPEKRDEFLALIQRSIGEKGRDYLRVIQEIGDYGASVCTEWLQGLIDQINDETLKLTPSFRP